MSTDFVIVGLGIGGLTAAIDAIRRGKSVTVLTDRDHYTRPQLVGLKNNYETVNYLFEISGITLHTREKTKQIVSKLKDILKEIDVKNTLDEKEKKFLKKIIEKYNRKANISICAIKDLEQFLYSRLLYHAKSSNNLNIYRVSRNNDSLGYSVDPKNHSITLDEGATLIEHDEQKNPTEKTLEESPTLEFSTLIGADGDHHCLAKHIQSKQSDMDLGYKKLDKDSQFDGPYHASVVFSLGSQKPTSHQTSLSVTVLNRLKKFGWEKSQVPIHNILQVDKDISVVCEIPKPIYRRYQDSKTREEARSKIIEWAEVIVKSFFQFEGDVKLSVKSAIKKDGTTNAYREEKSRLRAQAFKQDMHYYEKNAIPFPDKSGKKANFCIIGNAFFSPHYKLGQGANLAIVMAKKSVKSTPPIPISPKNLEEFNQDLERSHKALKKSNKDLEKFDQNLEKLNQEFSKKRKDILNEMKRCTTQKEEFYKHLNSSLNTLLGQISSELDTIDKEIARIGDEVKKSKFIKDYTTKIREKINTFKEKKNYSTLIEEINPLVTELRKTLEIERSHSKALKALNRIGGTLLVIASIVTIIPILAYFSSDSVKKSKITLWMLRNIIGAGKTQSTQSAEGFFRSKSSIQTLINRSPQDFIF